MAHFRPDGKSFARGVMSTFSPWASVLLGVISGLSISVKIRIRNYSKCSLEYLVLTVMKYRQDLV